MESMNKNRRYRLLIFSLVLLLNPNINVIDLLPDFIAWFILARMFRRAADSAPYFEEARAGFVRLGWLTLAKIPALLLIIFVRSKDTLDNNIYALVSTSFAVFEAILVISAARNIFSALFHLGERTDAVSLIAPFSSSQKNDGKDTPESLRNFTCFFLIAKIFLYVIPDMFMLTRVNDRGIIVAGSGYYPYVLIASLLTGTILGVCWFLRTKKYVNAISCEGKFYTALDYMASEDISLKFEIKTKLRSILSALTLMTVAAFFSMEFIFDNWNNINILPHFLYGILLLSVCFAIKKHIKTTRIVYAIGVCYCLVSLVQYILSVSFLSKYEYFDLVENNLARSSYTGVQIFGILEFVLLVLFLLFIAKAFNSLVLNHTGLSPDSDKYNKIEEEFHKSLKKKNYIMTSLGILAGASKCVNIFLNSDIQIFFTEIDIVSASALPWFNIIVTGTSLAYIGFTFFYMSSLKEEINMKYRNG